ncbi:MAG: Ig-like domain-containing protein [Egibacteraceae bacterium]
MAPDRPCVAARPRPRSPLVVALVLLAVLLPASPAAAAEQTGFQAHSFEAFKPTSGPLTGEKPESKLWYHDGAWWAAMLSPAANGAHTIHRLDNGTWTDTGVLIDDRVVSKEDVLSLGDMLYIVSRKSWKLRRYQYVNGRYVLDDGYPRAVPSGGETLTLARDTQGSLWLAWEGSNEVRVAHSTNEGASWSTAVLATNVSGDDIAAVIAFTDGTGPAIGVMWSNQNAGTQLFAVHRDGAATDAWTVEEALKGSGEADDHINLKTYQGRVFAVVKTSKKNAADPLIRLLLRSPDGAWSQRPVATVEEGNTRPITMLHIDAVEEQLYVFMTIGEGSGARGISYKKASLPNLVGGGGFPDPAVAFIRGPNDDVINNATSMKANGTAESGIVVLATSETHYWWNQIGGSQPPPSANTAPTAVDGSATTEVDVAAAVTLQASDPEECELTFSVVDPPTHGTLSAVTDNPCASGSPNDDTATTTYTPELGFTGSDTFTFKANDGQADSNTATITVTIQSTTGDGGEGDGIALRASSSGVNTTATTLEIGAPAGTASGDVMVASVDVRKLPAITAPSGWQLLRSTDNGSGMRKATYVKAAGSGEPASYTWTLSSAQEAAGGILSYTGVDASTPVLAHDVQVTTSRSKLITAPSVTTSVDGAMLIGLFGINGHTAITPPTSMAERWDVTSTGDLGISSAAADEPQPTAGASGDRVATAVDRKGINIGHLVALRPAL